MIYYGIIITVKIYRLLARKLENCYIKLCKNKNASNVIKSEPITNVLGEEQEHITRKIKLTVKRHIT